MTRSDDRGYVFGFGLEALLKFDASHSSGTYKAIVGEKDSEVELVVYDDPRAYIIVMAIWGTDYVDRRGSSQNVSSSLIKPNCGSRLA